MAASGDVGHVPGARRPLEPARAAARTTADSGSATTSRSSWTTIARYLEVVWAAQRSGIYFTPINFHFNADEVAYIVDDCDATRVRHVGRRWPRSRPSSPDLLPARVETRLVVGGTLDGYETYEEAIAAYPAEPLAEELEGHAMMYSSGTTGRPKGIRYHLERKPVGSPTRRSPGSARPTGSTSDCVYLSPAPLYHAAPLQFCIAVHRFGGTAVVLEHFDPEACLAAIERYRVTHAQFVPTMFVRMLKLPEEVRAKYDVSSLQIAIHAAAPCPVEIKRRMIEWWGPIIFEYYSSTEGMGSTMITSEEWLAHPGSVGQAVLHDDPHPRRGRQRAPDRRAGCRVVRARRAHDELRVPQGPGEDRAHARHARAGHRSATSGTSTTRATCTSPTGATS